jgi:hypothetical protein
MRERRASDDADRISSGLDNVCGRHRPGFISTAYLDRHYATVEAGKKTISATSSAACVGKDGSWVNWPWSNVPALSPKCSDER